MARHSIIVRIENGDIANKKAVRTLFAALKDGRYELTIDSANHRSLPMNRFYWGYVVPTVQAAIKDLGTELSKEETHDFLKAKFNYTEIVKEDTGEVERLPRSTASLTNVGFIEYLQKIQRFGAEFLNVEILDPNEELTIKYE